MNLKNLAPSVGLAAVLLSEQSAIATAPNTSAAATPFHPNDGAPGRWKIVGDEAMVRKEPLDSAPVIAQLAEGEIVSNPGCSKKSETVWCQIRPLRGGERGYVRVSGLQPAKGPDGIGPAWNGQQRPKGQKKATKIPAVTFNPRKRKVRHLELVAPPSRGTPVAMPPWS
jgi:hypothetical protein